MSSFESIGSDHHSHVDESGHEYQLILDDALVYSDDARLETLTEILTEAAGRMQVILLTCRDRAFRHLPGHRIVIGPQPPLRS